MKRFQVALVGVVLVATTIAVAFSLSARSSADSTLAKLHAKLSNFVRKMSLDPNPPSFSIQPVSQASNPSFLTEPTRFLNDFASPLSEDWMPPASSYSCVQGDPDLRNAHGNEPCVKEAEPGCGSSGRRMLRTCTLLNVALTPRGEILFFSDEEITFGHPTFWWSDQELAATPRVPVNVVRVPRGKPDFKVLQLRSRMLMAWHTHWTNYGHFHNEGLIHLLPKLLQLANGTLGSHPILAAPSLRCLLPSAPPTALIPSAGANTGHTPSSNPPLSWCTGRGAKGLPRHTFCAHVYWQG